MGRSASKSGALAWATGALVALLAAPGAVAAGPAAPTAGASVGQDMAEAAAAELRPPPGAAPTAGASVGQGMAEAAAAELRPLSGAGPLSHSNQEQAPTVSNFGSLQVRREGTPMPLPLRHTDVDLRVHGRVTTAAVTQRFANPFPEPIEAVYVFPLPADAAVYAYRLEVGGRTLQGELMTKAAAWRTYKLARWEGRAAGLLDQERPNVFVQQVANILPGEDVTVHLSYVALLPYRQGAYELVFPMVVGPRYRGTAPPDSEPEDSGEAAAAPLLGPGERPGHDVTLRASVHAGGPIRELHNPTHAVRVLAEEEGHVLVELSDSEVLPNRDFVLRFAVAGRQPSCSLLTHSDDRGGFFVLLVQPQAEAPPDHVTARELMFVVDVSGSVNGAPLRQSTELVRRALQELGPQDRLQVVRFSSKAEAAFPAPVRVTPTRVEHAVSWLEGLQGRGGTELVPALDLALNTAPDPRRARVVLLLTDGFVGYEGDALRYLRDHGSGTSFFPLGLGAAPNRFLIDALARIGQTEALYLLPSDDPEPAVRRFYDTVAQPTLTGLRADFGAAQVRAVTPATLPDLFVQRPLYLAGRYEGAAPTEVNLAGTLGGRAWRQRCRLAAPETEEGPTPREGVALLWARLRIRELMDQWRTAYEGSAELRREITELSLAFGLTTRFTSFVAVDAEARTARGRPARVAIPLALPEGVRLTPAHATEGVRRAAGRRPLRAPAPPMDPVGGSRVGLSPPAPPAAPRPGRSQAGRTQSLTSRARSSLPATRARAERRVATRSMVSGSASRGAGLAMAGIARTMRRNLRSFRRVFERALRRSPKLSGKLVLTITIGTDGRVDEVKLEDSTLNDRALAEGLMRVIRKWRFPPPADGAPVTIRYPLVFSPG